MLIHCLRHGLTVENLAGIYHGPSDGTLTPTQRAALATVSFDVSGYDAIYCSPTGRCRDTAHALGLHDYVSDRRISERHFGIFEGLTRAECERRFPTEFAAFLRFDRDYALPGGESRGQHFARVQSWIEDAGTYRSVLAVTHGGTIDFLYRLANGLDLHGGSTIFAASNASLSSFDVEWPRVRLVSYDTRLHA